MKKIITTTLVIGIFVGFAGGMLLGSILTKRLTDPVEKVSYPWERTIVTINKEVIDGNGDIFILESEEVAVFQ